MMGPSLENLFEACNHHFTIPTVLALAQQMVT